MTEIKLSINFDEWFRYTNYCTGIIKIQKQKNDMEQKKIRMSYKELCETYLPSFEEWKKLYDI